MNKLKKTVIVVAGGTGKRMRTEKPKQFVELCGKPILMHSISAFLDYDQVVRIILVLPAMFIEQWENMCRQYDFSVEHEIIEGGNERFFSVKNGLDKINKECLIAIHDGVRPLVSRKTISDSFKIAEKSGSAIPVVPVNESLRYLKNASGITVNRNDYRLVQTPQVFRSSLIKAAYDQAFSEKFTDDASVFEAAGGEIYLVEGNFENIKITRPIDLVIAEALLKARINV